MVSRVNVACHRPRASIACLQCRSGSVCVLWSLGTRSQQSHNREPWPRALSYSVNAFAKHIILNLVQNPTPVTWGGNPKIKNLILSSPTVPPFTDGAKEYGTTLRLRRVALGHGEGYHRWSRHARRRSS